MKANKKSDEFADLVSRVSALSKKDYKALWLITRQYRKADRSLEKTFIRQKKEQLPKTSKAEDKTAVGLGYELA